MALPPPFSTTVHPFTSPTSPQAYSCAYERGNPSSRNALIYIGGLTSGPHTTLELLNTLLSFLDDTGLGYSIWEARMRSSFTGWGYSSLENDVEDIAALVKYLGRLGKERVVLLGSSTGCQDCMKYMKALETGAPEITACILQAPTSDRVTAGMLMPPDFYRRTLDHSKDLIAQGNKDSIMPKDMVPEIFTSPISAYRWHSLIAKGGDDDYFSDDLDDAGLATTFGRISRPTLIMPSENDEMMPSAFPKQVLLQRWIRASPGGLSNSELPPFSTQLSSLLTAPRNLTHQPKSSCAASQQPATQHVAASRTSFPGQSLAAASTGAGGTSELTTGSNAITQSSMPAINGSCAELSMDVRIEAPGGVLRTRLTRGTGYRVVQLATALFLKDTARQG
ncbi:hypothetical protein OPT61_g3812 [Boeremia exigua]|uniref:Uncharacterized protein n=1 Tax=Boeremia exigua TaxID=749465 RepID=A0ACC2IGC5_9PLEO|nr:hypothetical protein OPT61_g3812 [Boeremia exigua]